VPPPDPTPTTPSGGQPVPNAGGANTSANTEPKAPSSSVSFGGFLQPQYRLRQDSPAANDNDGFKFARARLTATGQTHLGSLSISGYIEAELQPQFSLFDAYATFAAPLPNRGKLIIDAGQMRVPIGRQALLSDTRLSFVDKAALATLVPDRDLGTRATLTVPALPQVRLIGGVFDGEGKNQVENINERFLYVARIEISPFGGGPNGISTGEAPIQESAFAGDFLTVAASYAHNNVLDGSFNNIQIWAGADVAFAWKGLSGEAEYLWQKQSYEGGAGSEGTTPPATFHARGWVGQLAYLLPIELPPIHKSRLEVGVRVEEIDRNDTTPITVIGDPNQSVLEYTAIVSYYLKGHSIKLQLAASHFTEIEDKTATNANASYPNDQLLLQLTYRLE
jgi:hypothetical protein